MRYTIGIDFGTLSARAVVYNIENGKAVYDCHRSYGAYDNQTQFKVSIKDKAVIADPDEYLNALYECIIDILKFSPAKSDEIKGLCIDATSLSLLSLDKSGNPLCCHDKYKDNHHAYIKLWKSHSAKKEADIILDTALREKESFVKYYSSSISSEWALPKILEIVNDCPKLYDDTVYYMDLCEWLTFKVCGKITRSLSAQGLKFFYTGQYPEKSFYLQLNRRLENLQQKFCGPILKSGQIAGFVDKEFAAKTGLSTSTVVAAGLVDGNSAMVAAGAVEAEDALFTVGTSLVYSYISEHFKAIDGVCGIVKDGIFDNLYAYEAGLCCVGDLFAWVVNNITPAEYFNNAKNESIPIHSYLTKLAFNKQGNDILALDWFNGNRCPVCNDSLTGVVTGLTLNTKVEDIYRALIEATGFGLKRIYDNFILNGLKHKNIYVCGGISLKNRSIMQCYADILQKPLHVLTLDNLPALGSALMAAVAAGEYKDYIEASLSLKSRDFINYYPDVQKREYYRTKFGKYLELCRVFGG